MKKSRFIKLICLILVISVLVFSLTACLKIGLKTNNLIDTLKDEGFSVNYIYKTPMTQGGGSKYKYEDILYVYKADDESAADVDDDQIDGGDTTSSGTESGSLDPVIEEETPLYIMYVIYCSNDDTGDFAEEQCKIYIELEENSVKCTKWVVYRYDNIVLCGNIEIVAIARGY